MKTWLKYNCILIATCSLLILPFFNSKSSTQDLLLPVTKTQSIKLKKVDSNAISLDLKKNTNIVSPADGKLSLACFAESSSSLRLITKKGLSIFLYPIKLKSIYLKLNQDVVINQGDYIGETNDTYPINDKCDPIKDDGFFINFRKSQCPFVLDSININCTDVDKELTSTNIENKFDTNCNQLLEDSYTLGEKGLKIVLLQTCLEEQGKFKLPGGITGFYGSYTKGLIDKTPKTDTSKSSKCNVLLASRYFIGQKGEDIYQLQQCLIDKNYYNYDGGITGYYGNYTNEALNNFINSSPEACKILKNGSYFFGENSNRVKRLQQCLREVGKFNFPNNTGFFGLKTQQAYKDW